MTKKSKVLYVAKFKNESPDETLSGLQDFGHTSKEKAIREAKYIQKHCENIGKYKLLRITVKEVASG